MKHVRTQTMKFKANATLLLVTLLGLLIVASSSDELNRDPERDLTQCEQKCQRQQPYFEEHKCRKQCQSERAAGGDVDVDGRENREEITKVGDAEREYERCQGTCHGTGKGKWQCQRKCQDEYEAALRRERREPEREPKREPEHHDEHHGGGDRHPRGDYRHCVKKCEDREEGFSRQRQCKLRCEDRYGRQEHRGHREGEPGRRRDDIDNKQHKEKEKEKGKSDDNPYYFNSKSFESRYSTQEGSMRVLQRFSEKSDLLSGIDKFRVGFYEANPNTFMLPHHWDADSVIFVIGGKATMTFLKQENRETFNLERGDVLVIPAGTTAYLVNTHNDEKLQVAELLHPVNTPGQYEQFFGVGGQEPESFFNSFSTEILQAALNVPREQLERLFKQHAEGAIIKARHDQVRALAQRGMSTTRFREPKRFGESEGPLNLLDEEPLYSNDHGEFYQVSPNDYQQLRNLDLSVGYCDIKQGSMMAPHFNSRTTFVVLVVEGSGYFEMACPHVGKESNKEKQTKGTRYQKLRSNLSQGDVFIIPAGHPISIVASENESLRTIGFGINAQNNKRNFLAGQENIINQLDHEAMELSFKMPAMEVEEMFQRQRNSYFMAGPEQQKRALLSVLDFAGF